MLLRTRPPSYPTQEAERLTDDRACSWGLSQELECTSHLANRLEYKGISRLFEITPVVTPTLVRLVEPWEPPEVLTGPLPLYGDDD
jgi:hypothetical protein